MHRASYIGFLVVILAAGLLFFYATKPVLVEPKMSAPVTAEFGGVELAIELATTPAAQELGLGFRTEIPDNYGMLFVFKEDGAYGFWMKDTLVPLDIFWLDRKGQVVTIAENVATSSYPDVFNPSAPARYVLEMAAGFAQAHHITNGSQLLLKNFPSVLK